MENKRKAVLEVLGWHMKAKTAKKFFYNVYEFFLYNDTKNLLKTLDFRMGISTKDKPQEDYHLFKYMLQLLLQKHPGKLSSLIPSIQA